MAILNKDIAQRFREAEHATPFSDGRRPNSFPDYPDGFIEMSSEAAQILAECNKTLYLTISTLSDSAATALSRHAHNIRLRGLRALSDNAAMALSRYQGDWLDILDLECLSETPGHVALAEKFASFGKDIYLNSLSTLSTPAAAALSTTEASVYLDGLKSLPESTVLALAQHAGDLSLDGLESLSETASMALANSKSILSLRGLKAIASTPAGVSLAARLAARQEELELHLTDLPDSVAKALAKYKGERLVLNRLKTLSAGAATALAKVKAPLNLAGIETLSSEAVESLSKYSGGELVLSALVALPDEAIRSLAKIKGHLELGLQELPAGAAVTLVRRKGQLGLPRLTSLADEDAQILAAHPELELSSAAAAAVNKFRNATDVQRKLAKVFFFVECEADEERDVIASVEQHLKHSEGIYMQYSHTEVHDSPIAEHE